MLGDTQASKKLQIVLSILAKIVPSSPVQILKISKLNIFLRDNYRQLLAVFEVHNAETLPEDR